MLCVLVWFQGVAVVFKGRYGCVVLFVRLECLGLFLTLSAFLSSRLRQQERGRGHLVLGQPQCLLCEGCRL